MEGQNLTPEQMFESLEENTGAGAHGEQQPAQEQQQAAPDAGPQYLDLEQYKTHHVKYNANGNEVSEPFEMVLKRASQGYNYAQRAEGLNKREAEIKSIQEANEGLQKWKQYDEYARQNPQWAEHVQTNWDNRGQVQPQVDGLEPDNPVMGVVNDLRSTVAELQSQLAEQKSTVDDYASRQQAANEDREFNSEIDSAREKFGKMLDFDTPDEEGKTIEYKVMEHMQQHNIPNFQAALTNLYMDQLLTAQSQQALEQQAKQKQAQTKQGIIGVSPTPGASKHASTAQPRNYQDASAALLAELG